MSGTTTTLCVRRATYWDEEMGAEDPAKKGVCSNYLCDAPAGTKLKLTGPAGKVSHPTMFLYRSTVATKIRGKQTFFALGRVFMLLACFSSAWTTWRSVPLAA